MLMGTGSEFFTMILLKAMQLHSQKNLHSIIFTKSSAKKYFGNHKALNANIDINNNKYTVTGIVADAQPNSGFQYNAFIPLEKSFTIEELRENNELWGNSDYITFVRLKPAVNHLDAAKKITALLQKNSGEKETYIGLILVKEMQFEKNLQTTTLHGIKIAVNIFSVLAFLLLLVACIYYVNLTSANSGNKWFSCS